MKSTLATMIIVGVLTALLVAPASAQVQARENNEVVMGEYLLLRIRCPYGGMTQAERAGVIQKRVNDLLVLGGIDLGSVRVVQVGSEAAVYAGGRLLVTATMCEAQANNTTPMRLASYWANRFRALYPLALPKRPAAAFEEQ